MLRGGVLLGKGGVLSIMGLFLLLAHVLGAIEYVVVNNIGLRGNMIVFLWVEIVFLCISRNC